MLEKNQAKIAIIIAFKDFKDEEYFISKDILESAGAEIKTASSKMGIAIGLDGGEANVDFKIGDLNVSGFDAIIFVGGPGAAKLINDESCQGIAKEAVEKGKILGAICIAPAILAKAGVLKGKKATVWSSALDKSAIKILEENGAEYQDENIVVGGKIITSSGPAAAKEFAEKIIELLTGK